MAVFKHGAEKKMQEQAEIIHVLLNATNDMHYLLDASGHFIAVNEALADRSGQSVDELIQTPASALVDSGVLSPTMAGSAREIILKHPIRYEESFHDRWYEIRIHPISDSNQQVRQYAVHVHDITQNKVMEGRLRKLTDLMMKQRFPERAEGDIDLADLEELVELEEYDEAIQFEER